MTSIKNISKTIVIILISTIAGLIFCEIILRVKHHFVIDYDVEMWRYAKELKTKVDNKKINHVHIKNKSARLQNTNININKYGQRDINYDNKFLSKFEKRFLILGSSITLGWGVDQEKTFTSYLNKKSKEKEKNWIFVNGGIGNYNTERYVNNYLQNWSNLDFTDIIIHFFVNDTEAIKETKQNFFLTHTHLGVVIWKLINSYTASFEDIKIENYYKTKYEDSYIGYKVAKKELLQLKKHCTKKELNCYVVLMPDIHKLNPYKLSFINEKIKNLSKQLEYPFLDLLNDFSNLDEKKVWNKYNDPHPNEFGHLLIGQSVFKFLDK